jgi:uncharacterized membrane protein
MQVKAKVLGHPVHQMLIVFPLGLLVTSLIFDFIYLGNRSGRIADASFWMISAGIIGALCAAAFGVIDWLGIPTHTRAKAIGLWHGIGNIIVVGLFILSWVLRYNASTTAPSGGAIWISAIAVGLALVTGWLGGEMVDRLGIGVDEGAHLNAPNSITSRPATDTDTDYTREAAPAPAHRVTPGRTAGGPASREEDEQRRPLPGPVARPSDQGRPPA